jgi:alkylation response protein AidB-like acyl-CoA dehydrogenase
MPMSVAESLTAARKLRGLIESEAELVEQKATMTPKVVDALVDAGLFRLLVPRGLGGTEADPGTLIDVCEELSFADGSVGWAFAQNTTVLAYAAYLQPDHALPLARARAGAGMFAPLGVAHREDGGFRISGSYPFGSGCGHAEYMGGSAMVMQDGEVAPFENGLPQIRAFIVPSDRVFFKGNWDVMGLRGTGSFDFEVPEQHVDVGMTFSLFETRPITGGALYGLGPVVVGTISSVAWALGVASRALHEIAEIGKAGRIRLGSLSLREQQTFQRDFGLHSVAVKAARLLAKESYGSAVEAIARGEAPEVCEAKIRETKAAASYVPAVAKAAVTFAYEASGSQGLRNPSRLQRCFRDIYAGAAHQVFDERNYTEVAKSSLGLEPAPF